MTVKYPNHPSPARLLVILLLFLLYVCLMENLHITSLNINGARDSRKKAALYESVKQKRVDVLLVQETHSDDQVGTYWEKEWAGRSRVTTPPLLFSKHFCPISFSTEEVIKGRLLKIKALFEEHILVFICVYALVLAVLLCKTIEIEIFICGWRF